MTSNPHMPAAYPIPVAAEPNVSRLRRHADDFYLRDWRSDRNGTHVNGWYGNPD
jgi:hypothetical protein